MNIECYEYKKCRRNPKNWKLKTKAGNPYFRIQRSLFDIPCSLFGVLICIGGSANLGTKKKPPIARRLFNKR